MAGLTLGAQGHLYGTTGVATNRTAQGNVFAMKPPAHKGKPWTFSVSYTFTGSPDGAGPAAALVPSKGGMLFSTTQNGGTGTVCQGGCGTVFEVSP